MKKSEVSPEFMGFLGRNHTKIQEAKNAESRANNIPVPMHAEGTCVVTEFKFGKSKDKQNQDGSVKEGSPFGEMHLTVVDHPEHSGKVLKRQWWFTDSPKMDAAGRYQMFLDDMEKLGLPREIRMNHDSPSDIGDYFLTKEGLTLHFRIVENKYNSYDDFKEVRLSTIESHIPSNDSVAPPVGLGNGVPAPSVAQAPAPTTAASPVPPSALKPGTKVVYLEQDCVVVDFFADTNKVHIKGADNPGFEKIVAVDKLEKIG